MQNKQVKHYTEVTLPETDFSHNHFNKLSTVYQYEYALLQKVSQLFTHVACQSFAPDNLKMYYLDLPVDKTPAADSIIPEESKPRKTRGTVREEIQYLIQRDLIGHITFPQMNICAAQVYITLDENQHHKFIFTDNIYGFSVQLGQFKNGRPTQLLVNSF